MKHALLAALLLSLTACQIPNEPMPAIEKPPSASTRQIEDSILAGIAAAPGGWVVEKREPGVFVAGLTQRTHYLQVTLNYSGDQVVTTITGSKNLQQDGDMIHRHGMKWHRNLNYSVQKQLDELLAATR